MELHRGLAIVAVAHVVIGVLAAIALAFDAPPVAGAHPALKPMKFGFSIALFLGTMAVLVPALSVGAWARAAIAWVLVATMIAEMAPILVQAARGTGSHFNGGTPLDAFFWKLMLGAIVVATVTMLGVAVVAIARPLVGPGGEPLSPLMTAAWRVGVGFFFLAALTGFQMGGQLAHSVGGPDGEAGMRMTGWSLRHGDLRVPHFVGVHAMQTLPVAGFLLVRAPLDAVTRWALFGAVTAAHVGVAGWTLARALAGRPPW